MPRIYDNNFKFMMVDLIVNKKNSTSKTAEKYGVPLKTLEKWITSYNKNPHCFDHVTEIVYDFNPVNNDNDINYDDLNKDELKNIIMKKDIEIAR